VLPVASAFSFHVHVPTLPRSSSSAASSLFLCCLQQRPSAP
jgi:hypothetical protein